ncbi:MAG: hypothetical protein GY791_01325 [Alphaproteobacteria bacterium]|nr:hypothetical protein [Alphaproteobacteria bacterium]
MAPRDRLADACTGGLQKAEEARGAGLGHAGNGDDGFQLGRRRGLIGIEGL